MTLLICLYAAVASTVIWYRSAPNDTMKTSLLCWMFWGASVMWLCDAVFEYAEQGAAYFAPAPAQMLNDAYLGLYAVAAALTVWIAAVLISDPRGTVKAVLLKQRRGK